MDPGMLPGARRRWSRSLGLVVSGCLLVALDHATLGCGQCGGDQDTAFTQDLRAFQPDSGVDGGIEGPPCSSCAGPVVEQSLCLGWCHAGQGASDPSQSSLCVQDACVETVTSPESSCADVCNALTLGQGISGCSFSQDRSRVTCDMHQSGACRCSVYDC